MKWHVKSDNFQELLWWGGGLETPRNPPAHSPGLG